jgi:hypothetical protein
MDYLVAQWERFFPPTYCQTLNRQYAKAVQIRDQAVDDLIELHKKDNWNLPFDENTKIAKQAYIIDSVSNAWEKESVRLQQLIVEHCLNHRHTRNHLQSVELDKH